MNPPSPLIDVLSADSFDAEHLPNAINLCVYETGFTDKVIEAFPDKTTPITVYGLSDQTQEAAVATSRLRAAGYTNVTALPGGLRGWQASGGKIERAAIQEAPPTGRFQIDQENSLIRWTGRNLFNFHTGALKLGIGHVDIADGRLTGAVITVDMTSLQCSDITDSTLNAALISHLRNADFFDVAAHPQATFTLTSSHAIAGATAGRANFQIEGSFKLRGRSLSIEFPALIAEQRPGVCVAQAELDLDRTLWGASYGSGKFFARLGQHVVNDLVHIQLKITTIPNNTQP